MLLWLADALEPEPKKTLLRSAYWLWVGTATVGVLFIVLLTAALVARRSRRIATGSPGRRRKGRPIPDAWAEAGRRVEPIRMDEPPPDVIDDPPEDRS
jgi:hypothetical protein